MKIDIVCLISVLPCILTENSFLRMLLVTCPVVSKVFHTMGKEAFFGCFNCWLYTVTIVAAGVAVMVVVDIFSISVFYLVVVYGAIPFNSLHFYLAADYSSIYKYYSEHIIVTVESR